MIEIDAKDRGPGERIDCTTALRSCIVLLLDFFEEFEEIDPNVAYDTWLQRQRGMSAVMDVLITMDIECESWLTDIRFHLPEHISTAKIQNPLKLRDEKRKAESGDTAYSDFGDDFDHTTDEAG